ncbi:MAG TPA: cytochrome P460 family protein [Terriglobales bacterium]|nr:cytochrome P460 family protein [Terriglobales bacterium]
MRWWIVRCLLFVSLACLPLMQAADSTSSTDVPTYTADGKMLFPTNYRSWVFLTSGVDMSYSPNPMNMGHSVFDNVFVNPDSYKAFLQTGTWPDKTMLVLEVRKAGDKASINKSGHFQTPELMGREVHVRDDTRFEGKWAFFGFDTDEPSKMVPKEAACYSCHQAHAAVDTTFVQFYPTLIGLAKDKGTLSANYLNDEKALASGQKEGKK